MKALRVSPPGSARHLAVSGGVLAVVDVPEDAAARGIALALAVSVADSAGYQRLALAEGHELVTTPGGRRFVAVRGTFKTGPGPGTPSAVVVTFHEYQLELGHDGEVSIEVLEPTNPERLQ